MALVKISELASAAAISGTELIPLVQLGNTKRSTASSVGSAGASTLPTIQVTDYGPFVGATADQRRSTIAAATAVWELTGGTLEYPGGTFDMSGGTASLPLTVLNIHTTYHMKGNNTRFTTTTAHPIFADAWPANQAAVSNRLSRRFVVEHCHFEGSGFSGVVGQTGLRIVGSYLSVINECSFQGLDDGLDLVFCLGAKVMSCGFANGINHDLRFRYGMEINAGLGTRTALWSGAAETNSNGNCVVVDKCRFYGLPPSTTMTVTNKALTSNVATLTTSATLPAEFKIGRWVHVAGVDATFNGIFKITAVPTTTSFTYDKAAANVASTAATGTAAVSTRAQIAIEAISEVLVSNCQTEGLPPIDGILYDQGGSTTAKGLTVLEHHPEQQPLNSHIRIVGTGGGAIVVQGGSFTQGAIMMDASAFTTGSIFWNNQSFLPAAGKWRAGGALWSFGGYTGLDPFDATRWDGAVAAGFPIIRTAITAREGSGFGSAGVLSFEGIAFISTKNVIRFITEQVSPKIAMFLAKGVEMGLWGAAPNPATQTNSSVVRFIDEAKKTLNQQVKDSAGVSTTSADAYNQPGRYAGTGTPEGAVVAAVGSIFQRTDGGAGTCFYVKESGASNTGWVAK